MEVLCVFGLLPGTINRVCTKLKVQNVSQVSTLINDCFVRINQQDLPVNGFKEIIQHFILAC